MELVVTIAAGGAVALLLRVLYVHTFVVSTGFVGVLSRNGRMIGVLRPGRHVRLGRRVAVTLVDMRRQELEVPGQEVLTADHVSVKISLLAEYRVVDALRALQEVTHWQRCVYTALQAALRHVVAGRSFDDVLRDRAALGAEIGALVQAPAASVGVEVSRVAVRDIMLSAELRRAFAEAVRQREEGKAALEKTRAETAALRALANAARLLREAPELLSLRTLQVLEAAASRPGNTLVVGSPPGLAAPGNGQANQGR